MEIAFEIQNNLEIINFKNFEETSEDFRKDFLKLKDDHLTEITINFYTKILNKETSKNEIKQIGFLKGVYFDPAKERRKFKTTETILSLAQNYSTELTHFVGIALDNLEDKFKENLVSSDEGLFYLEHIEVDRNFRRKGIGSYIMNNLQLILFYSMHISVNTICLLPALPFEVEEEYIKNNKRIELDIEIKILKKFFKKLRL